MSALASARATSLDLALVRYLESLCSRAYYFVYGVRARPLERIIAFLARELPAQVKSLWRETIISALLFGIGAVVAYVLVIGDPDWFYVLHRPRAWLTGAIRRRPTEYLRNRRFYGGGVKDPNLGVLASFLFTPTTPSWRCGRSRVGFALCVPTALFHSSSTASSLGAFLAVFVERGLRASRRAAGWRSTG